LMPQDIYDKVPPDVSIHLQQGIENLFRPEIQPLLTANVQTALRGTVAEGAAFVFWAALIVSCICLFFSYKLPKSTGGS